VSNVVTLDPARQEAAAPGLEAVAVVRDPLGRVLFTHSEDLDLWSLPSAPVAGEATPREAIASVLGPVGPALLLGLCSSRDRRLIAYGYPEVEASAGVYLPPGLAPLNTDPCHLAIAGSTGGGSQLPERLELPTGPEHLAWLRRHETPPDFRSGAALRLIEAVSGSRPGETGQRAQQLARQAEAMIAAGELSPARRALLEATAVAGAEDVILLRCELRLEEITSEDGALPKAWGRLSESLGRRGRHADLILSHLGYAAGRRGRHRESQAYLRRALGMCEEPERRATLRYLLARRAIRLVPATA
jgi:hypothetical protein